MARTRRNKKEPSLTFENCRAEDNGGAGFRVRPNTMIENSTAINNKGGGVVVQKDTEVEAKRSTSPKRYFSGWRPKD